jgi:hypothetical protein
MTLHNLSTKTICHAVIGAALALATLGVQATSQSAFQEREWNFKVFLDGKPIGTHRFEVIDNGNRREVRSDASFDVDFLFINAYRYRHLNREAWNDGCLSTIEARTDENSRTQTVRGTLGDRGFMLSSTVSGDAVLPACVMSFAYWDPRILEQKQLLNSQTGEYTPVQVTSLGADTVPVRGKPVPAQRYRLKAGDIVIDLWYTLDKQWLALESKLASGDKLRYVAERAPIQ